MCCPDGDKSSEGAECEHVAMGELDDVHHAEENGESHGHEAIDRPLHHTVQQVLTNHAHGIVSPTLAQGRFLSLRLPAAYSLSSQTVHLPSCTTYLVVSGVMFWP